MPPGVESGQHLAIVTAEFLYDVLIVEIPGIPVQETALPSTNPLEMQEYGRIDERILRREIMDPLVSCRRSQNIHVQGDDLR